MQIEVKLSENCYDLSQVLILRLNCQVSQTSAMLNFVSIRARKRLGEIGFAGLIVIFAWLLQITVLTKLSLDSVLCSLPLAITITWGAVLVRH